MKYRNGFPPREFGYALDNNSTGAEEMLGCLSEILDPVSQRHIDRTIEYRDPWLELGAGNGSMAYWMAQQGADVTAVDVNTRHIWKHQNVTIHEGDITCGGLPARVYRGIHARLLLAHLPEREQLIGHLVERLLPDGVLVVEDWGGAQRARMLACSDRHGPELWGRYQDALMAMFESAGQDPTWCQRAPNVMHDAGLYDISHFYEGQAWWGGEAGCRLPIVVCTQMQSMLIAHGIDVEELDRLRMVLADPDTWIEGNVLYTSIGRRRPELAIQAFAIDEAQA